MLQKKQCFAVMQANRDFTSAVEYTEKLLISDRLVFMKAQCGERGEYILDPKYSDIFKSTIEALSQGDAAAAATISGHCPVGHDKVKLSISLEDILTCCYNVSLWPAN